MSPLSSVQSITSSCKDFGVPENMCLCMKSVSYDKKKHDHVKFQNTNSKFPTAPEKKFLAEVRLKFFEEVKAYECVRNVDIEQVPVFYEYFSTM